MERLINKRLIEKYNLIKPESCTCEKCVGACKMSPCMCTPNDVIDMIENYNISPSSFKQSLNLTYSYMNIVNQPVVFIGLRDKGASCNSKLTDNGFASINDNMSKSSLECCMLENGLCKIHEFKPMGGVYTNTHESDFYKIFSSSSPEFLILKSWTERENVKSIERASELVNKTLSEHCEFMGLIYMQISSFKILTDTPSPIDMFRYSVKVKSLLDKMK